jgi:hypothetical protein
MRTFTAASSHVVNLFWTTPSTERDSRPTDPLGLDAMRTQLADVLVPCLTSRVSHPEDFYWSLLFLRWGSSDDNARERSFLECERLLKLWWVHTGRDRGFAGVEQAKRQAHEVGAPRTAYRPLLKTPRAQGLLGAHLNPLRGLEFVRHDSLGLTPDGETLVRGGGEALEPVHNGDWRSLRRAFETAGRGFTTSFVEKLKHRLADAMPDLERALRMVRWPERQSWGAAARHIGPKLAPYARLAGKFCDWADQVRARFDETVEDGTLSRTPLPAALTVPIPAALLAWAPLRDALQDWPHSTSDPRAMFAELHRRVFLERGYSGGDLWLVREEGRFDSRPGIAATRGDPEGSDCRWRNAVWLMGPMRPQR